MLTALETLVDGCHHVGGLLPGVQQSGLKGRNKSIVRAASGSPHTVKPSCKSSRGTGPGLRQYLVDGEDVRQEVAAAGAQQVYLLADVALQFVKAALCRSHLSLNLRHSKQTLRQQSRWWLRHQSFTVGTVRPPQSEKMEACCHQRTGVFTDCNVPSLGVSIEFCFPLSFKLFLNCLLESRRLAKISRAQMEWMGFGATF